MNASAAQCSVTDTSTNTSASGHVACQGTLTSCDDGNLCTQNACNPSTGQCQTQAVTYINLGQWNQLPKSYQAILTAACAEAYAQMIGKYDTDNVAALRRLVANGAHFTSETAAEVRAKRG